ncbi:MAG TPA: hypothetical protein VD794_00575 [Flavisolibacter sp.]|nr:hypothetical protein [Flavisolibacter sp.]
MSENKPYWQQRREQKLGIKPDLKAIAETPQKAKEQSLKEFYQEMYDKRPARCMESGKLLKEIKSADPKAKTISKMAIVAHILPKRANFGVPSMAKNPLNIVYLEHNVHTNMDQKGAAFVTKMKIFPLMKERVAMMWKDIPVHERKNVPDYFKPENA